MSFDFQKTFTFWNVVIGSSITWSMGFCTNQSMIQRFCALGSVRKARTLALAGRCTSTCWASQER